MIEELWILFINTELEKKKQRVAFPYHLLKMTIQKFVIICLEFTNVMLKLIA